MLRTKQPEIPDFRADHAKVADFCKVLDTDMKPFYLLAFLLTANRKEAEECLLSTVEGCDQNCVFKEWTRSWIKRCLIAEAIHIVFSSSGESGERRNLWFEGLGEPRVSDVFNALTGLDTLERFVFVMSILEGYSLRECSLLLECSMRSVVQLQACALRKLAELDPFFIANLTRPTLWPESA
jgi:hypothetical protein